MVMDATQPQQPSPQSVGREFVRQYYTLLNKAPGHLHRFYNNNSSFIHGESTLVVGQRDIHNRIQQLNFNDCHAKISQVDAQATLGNGVVVQVTGELSNDGQPMRRFTQTFVLAAQSPKKYYVHNDIFRYQDHLYTDDEGDGETRSENGDEHELPTATAATNDQQSQTVGAIAGGVVDQQQLPSQVVATAAGANVLSQQPQQIQQQVAQPTAAAGAPQQIFYSLATTGASGRPVTVLPAGPQAGAVPLPAQFAAATASQQVQTTQLNGVVAHDELLAAAAQQQTATVVAPITSPLVQPTGTVPVAQAGTPILQSSVGIVPAPAATVIPGFQQSPLVAPQGLQQPQQQQQLGNTPMHLVIQPTANVPKSVEIEDNAPVNNSISTNSVNENSTRSQTNVPVPKPPTPVAVDDFKTINEQQQQEKYEAAKQQQNEPKTYANLFKSTSSSPSGFVNAALQQQQQLQQQQNLNNVYHSTTSSATSYTTTTSTSATTFTNSSRLDNNLNSNGSLPQRNNSIRNNKDYEQRRSSNAQFGDNQQLFLGNIPHHASEDDLKGLFSRFGTVLELRILSKPANKLPPGVRNPLNYGFITFDDAESVQKCLSNCPLYFPENSPDAQKLNVEEKKPRPRNDLPPRQQIGGNNMNNNIGRNIGGGGNGPQSRSITNSNSNVMRNNGTNGGLSRSSGGGGGGPRVGGGNGGFQRNDRSGGASNGPLRGGGNNSQSGNTYGRR